MKKLKEKIQSPQVPKPVVSTESFSTDDSTGSEMYIEMGGKRLHIHTALKLAVGGRDLVSKDVTWSAKTEVDGTGSIHISQTTHLYPKKVI